MLGDSGIIGNYYFFLRDYEESLFLINYLSTSDTFVDIGSNLGHYTLLSSGLVGARTICIEPVNETFLRLKMNVEINQLKNVKMMKVGLSNQFGKLKISNNLGAMNRILIDGENKYSEIIPVLTLDEVLRNEKNVSVLKIDVEGYEKQILEGGFETLNNDNLKVVIIELNDSNTYYGYKENQILNIFRKFQFKPYEFFPNSGKLIALKKKNNKSYNTIFLRDLKYVKYRLKHKALIINQNTILMQHLKPNNIGK